MARGGGSSSGGDRRRTPKDSGRRSAKKKVCIFCSEHIKWVDYKDVNVLRRFMSDRGKIRARRVSGNSAQHHRAVAVAIKRARELALLPSSQRTVAERGGGRGRGPREDRGDRGDRGDREDCRGDREDRTQGGGADVVIETPVTEGEGLEEEVLDAEGAAGAAPADEIDEVEAP